MLKKSSKSLIQIETFITILYSISSICFVFFCLHNNVKENKGEVFFSSHNLSRAMHVFYLHTSPLKQTVFLFHLSTELSLTLLHRVYIELLHSSPDELIISL